MERDGYVSLWTGTFKTNADLQQYLLISYNEDGDAVPSNLKKMFKLITMMRILWKLSFLKRQSIILRRC
ncbi:immunity 22 family protein [Pseudobacillus badius]|nr:immunity 22 family protein [Bacillus badius]